MAQFDVYRNSDPEGSDIFPYLLDIQVDLLSDLSTRVVVPLTASIKPIKHLNPIFQIENKAYVMITQELAGVESSILGDYVVSLKERRSDILAAIDFMITGF
ncbi:MAG: CcdB family protein [Campylobacterales bacterium]|nr:CcdB family protein [Campylobacterales bacterium]